MLPRRPFPSRHALSAALALAAFPAARLAADSLVGGQSTAYTAVINFDRADYYVSERYNSGTPTAALTNLNTAILFNNTASLKPDAAGNILLPVNFNTYLENLRTASPNARYTFGLGSLNAIAGNATAIANFNTQLAALVATHGFTGVDIDWEDMPGNVSATTYGATVKAVASAIRTASPGVVISTSHASGAQYKPYVAQIASTVDFLNLQFYYSKTGAMDMATFKSTLTGYLDQGLQASQIRVGLPSYGMVDPSATSTTDKWRSWTNLINAGVDVTNLNQWTDPSNGQTYYFSGLNLIESKIAYAKANGFAGVFTWELTQDRDYNHPLSVNHAIDTATLGSVPVLELNDSNTGSGKLGTGTVTLGSGAVLNNGVLRFARSGTNTYANRIDGYGAVETTGTGTTVLTAVNTHTGGTRIATGSTLQIGSGGASGAPGTGAIANAGMLIFNHSDTATLANAVSGAGKFTKTGAGTLTLSGEAKSFGSLNLTGGTLVNTGALDIAGNALLGMGAAGTFRQTGGTVNITTAESGWGAGLNIGHKTGGNGVYELSGGTLNVLNGATVVGAGGGSSGTLTLTGGTANLKGLAFGTSTSDIATVHLSGGARLNLGSAGIANVAALPTAARAVNLGAGTVGALADWSTALALTLNDAATGTTFDTRDSVDGVTGRTITLTGALTGTGKLNKTGAGTLRLSGANTHAGGTTISGGTLVAGHAAALGSGAVTVAAGGALVIGNGVADTVTLGSGASLAIAAGGVLRLGSAAGSVTLVGAGGYDFSGTLDLNGLFDGVTGTQTYTLISGGSGAKNDNLAGITGYDSALMSATFADGMLTVTAVPEPSVYGLLGAGALAAAALVRRRRVA